MNHLRWKISSHLTITKDTVDSSATERLRKIKNLPAKNRGDLNSAVMSAAYYAQKYGKTMYCYAGDSHMNLVWRVSYKKSEYLNPIDNSGRRLLSVSPDLVVTWHELKD